MNEPSKCRWGFPGDVVELGEGVEDAMAREVEDETGIIVRPNKLLEVFDTIVARAYARLSIMKVIHSFIYRPHPNTHQ